MSDDDDGVAPMELEGDEEPIRPTKNESTTAAKKSSQQPPSVVDLPDDDMEESKSQMGEDIEEEYVEQPLDAEPSNEDDLDDSNLSEEQKQERRDQMRQRQRRQQAKTKEDLKTFNDALSREDVQQAFISRPGGLGRAATKLVDISKNIKEGDVGNAILDAQGLDKLGQIGQKKAALLTKTTKIDKDEMIDKFISYYAVKDDGAYAGIDWFRWGKEVSQYWRTVDATSFMKGLLGLQVVAKEKKAPQRRKKNDSDDDEPITRAVQLQDTSKEAASMTDKRVTLLFHHLPVEPQNFFAVLMHPTSFTQSVENLFDLTFLIKKGQAEVTIDPELDIPVVRKIGSGGDEDLDDEEEQKAEQTNFQCIIKMDQPLWQRIVKAFKITKSFLPDRSKEYAKQKAAATAASSAASTRKSTSGQKRRHVPDENENDDAITAADKIPDHFTLSQPTLRQAFQPRPKKARTAAAAASSSVAAAARQELEDDEPPRSALFDDDDEE